MTKEKKDQTIEDNTEAYEKLQSTIDEKEANIKTFEKKLQWHEEAYTALLEKEQEKFKQLAKENTELKVNWADIQAVMNEAREKLNDKEQEIKLQEQLLATKKQLIEEKEQAYISLQGIVSEKDAEIEAIEAQMEEQVQKMLESESQLNDKESQLIEKEESRLKLQDAVVSMETEMNSLVKQLNDHEKKYTKALEREKRRMQKLEAENAALKANWDVVESEKWKARRELAKSDTRLASILGVGSSASSAATEEIRDDIPLPQPQSTSSSSKEDHMVSICNKASASSHDDCAEVEVLHSNKPLKIDDTVLEEAVCVPPNE